MVDSVSDETFAMSRGSIACYKIARAVVKVWAKVWFRLEIIEGQNVPASGGFILAPGAHRSYLDTPVATIATSRLMRFMGAENYFTKPLLGRFLYAMGGFPVERTLTDREAVKLAQQLLLGGEPLVIFPEGSRLSGPVIDSAKDGAAFLACRAGVPIVPLGLGGLERSMPKGSPFVKPTKSVVVFGEPIHPPVGENNRRVKRSQVKKFNEDVVESLQACFDEAQIRSGC